LDAALGDEVAVADGLLEAVPDGEELPHAAARNATAARPANASDR
jgi:hypothetical protein